MRAPVPRRGKKESGLRLWPVGPVLALAFAAALLVASSVFYAGWDLLGARDIKTERRIDSKTLFDLVKLAFGVVAGAGALVALVVAYRRQRLDEDGALRDATRLHTERFTTAVSQLGDDSAAVRLGGVHALAGLADDAPTRELRQTCIDVLCAYLRLPYTAEADLPADDAAARHAYLSLREVRHTVIRVIRDRLRLDAEHAHSWQGHDFDFTNVTFDGGDFSGSVFSSGMVNFAGATFCGGMVHFAEATFSGGVVNFAGAMFSGGTTSFDSSTFSGSSVQFHKTRFTDSKVRFRMANFSGGKVSFAGATFSGATVSFHRAAFSGATVNFHRAAFSRGAVSFAGATFAVGTVSFTGAAFSGSTLHLGRARFCGGVADMSNVQGETSPGLIPPFPPGLILPTAWQPPET
ncbi:pentapeptide repeat-containing protein [Streptomyces sp. CC224B]|uniref:pentapeptide repeat-containing protein n=1 Tax=Streptomyces sp. CC224B TaxID=3044571 RepID=UPI0024A9EA9A|nr:pentapeptide repeat-containing protein [Streptomyces sp. CC224B]